MKLFKENCIYHNLKTNIAIYLILNFFTGNIYYFYFQFKITQMFKYAKSTESVYEEAKTHLYWMFGTLASFISFTIIILSWLAIDFEGFIDFIVSYGTAILYIPITILFIAGNVFSITWAYKIRKAIRAYNIAVYDVDYTANGFFTFFCPGIVFIWAIENTPNESRFKAVRNSKS